MEKTTTPSDFATFQFSGEPQRDHCVTYFMGSRIAGTGVTVIGRLPACGYSITVNGTPYSPNPLRNTTNPGNSQLFLLSPGSLAMGQHTLIIQAQNATSDMPLYLTAFQYNTSDDPPTTSFAVVTSTIFSSASASTTAADPSRSTDQNPSSFPYAIVIGASLGGVLLLVLVSIVAWCLLKRKKSSKVEGYKKPEISSPDRFGKMIQKFRNRAIIDRI